MMEDLGIYAPFFLGICIFYLGLLAGFVLRGRTKQ